MSPNVTSLKTLAPAPTKKAFQAGVKTVSAPRAAKVRYGDDPTQDPVKILFFGEPGTGKTFSLARLLELGYKVFILVTDIGGTGSKSIKLYLKNVLTRPELLKNLVEIQLNGYEEVQNFLDNPKSFFPEIYDFDPDFIAWDSYSGFQQVDLSEYVGNMTPSRNGDVSEARASGLQFETTDWGMIRNASIRCLDKFLSLNNSVSGKIWHKIVICHESVRMKAVNQADGSVVVAKNEPLIQGTAKAIIGGGFDLTIRTVVKTTGGGEETDNSGRAYHYIIAPGGTSAAKNRGYEFRNDAGEIAFTLPGNFVKVWKSICTQEGFTLPDA